MNWLLKFSMFGLALATPAFFAFSWPDSNNVISAVLAMVIVVFTATFVIAACVSMGQPIEFRKER